MVKRKTYLTLEHAYLVLCDPELPNIKNPILDLMENNVISVIALKMNKSLSIDTQVIL